MNATEMQVLGIALLIIGVVIVVTAQILLSHWLKRVKKESQEENG